MTDICSKKISSDNQKFLLILRLNEIEDSLIFTITDGFSYCWVKEMAYNDVQLLRNNMCLQGPYSAFFEYLVKSIQTKNYKIE